jgi:hypothetical protein
MADVTKSIMVRNVGTAITSNSGSASQTIVWNRSDEHILIRLTNSDATTALVRFKGEGYGGEANIDVQVPQNAVKGVFVESFKVKDVETQKVIVEILDTDGTSFGGTVTNIKIEVIESPKALID